MLARILTTALVGAVALGGCATPRQMMFDAEVDRLCAKDGGLRVHEVVRLPVQQTQADGYPVFWDFSKRELSLGPEYRVVFEEQLIKGSEDALNGAQIVKFVFEVYRRDGNQLLGSNNLYVRRGGDPIPVHPSSYACTQSSADLIKSIFIVKG